VPRVRDPRPAPTGPAGGAPGIRRRPPVGQRPRLRARREDGRGRRDGRRPGRGDVRPAPHDPASREPKSRSERPFDQDRDACPQVFGRSDISIIRTCPRPHPSGPCRPRAPGGA
jgi:hypothetical protein